jgi:hypothetical protein
MALVGYEVHTAALRAARAVGTDVALPPGVLHAPLDAEARAWLGRIWDTVEGALRGAYREGMEAARPLIEKASSQLAEMTTTLAKHAEDVQATIAARLDAYLQAAIDGALKTVRGSVSIGGRELRMSKVTVQQRITLSGSLQFSLSQVCEFVSEGEVTLSAEYEAG